MLKFVLVKHLSVCIEVYCMSVMRLSQVLSCPFSSGPASPQSSGFPLHPIHPITACTPSLYYISSHSKMALLFIVLLDHLAGNPPSQLHQLLCQETSDSMPWLGSVTFVQSAPASIVMFMKSESVPELVISYLCGEVSSSHTFFL